ncbi:hypothetical protein KIN20_026897 [Parelaphostrongylus tenuis]|uniref:Uncharacterized protein n=1 Tax=Parelaphostrongylus tenuis TaxID=148309 RepID=A0AAD5WDJ1_PARTN|nr:hypothetical protein KIN20_026897 [Parelaphostrongylus tenuis]
MENGVHANGCTRTSMEFSVLGYFPSGYDTDVDESRGNAVAANKFFSNDLVAAHHTVPARGPVCSEDNSSNQRISVLRELEKARREEKKERRDQRNKEQKSKESAVKRPPNAATEMELMPSNEHEASDVLVEADYAAISNGSTTQHQISLESSIHPIKTWRHQFRITKNALAWASRKALLDQHITTIKNKNN